MMVGWHFCHRHHVSTMAHMDHMDQYMKPCFHYCSLNSSVLAGNTSCKSVSQIIYGLTSIRIAGTLGLNCSGGIPCGYFTL